jgi:hypothetical protein
MIEKTLTQEVPLGDEIVVAEMLCQRAHDADYTDLTHRVAEAPRSPKVGSNFFAVFRTIEHVPRHFVDNYILG